MQSDGNSFCGDIVSYSFNKTFRDEDNNLYYESKYVRIIIMVILILYNILRYALWRF